MLRSLLQVSRSVFVEFRRNFSTTFDKIAVGDNALLRDNDPRKSAVFTKPLRPGGSTDTRWGQISHDDLIGMSVRDSITAKKGRELRVHLPTLEEYVVLTPRNVTPIYPDYANLIVSMLDLHVTSSIDSQPTTPDIEILEAGTGHGGLTLYLARALHAANPGLPHKVLEHMLEKRLGTRDQIKLPQRTDQDQSSSPDEALPSSNISSPPTTSLSSEAPDPADAIAAYKTRRAAVLHTLDNVAERSTHVQRLISAFRRGIYAPSIDFHVGDLTAWLEAQAATRRASPSLPTDPATPSTPSPSSPSSPSSPTTPFLTHAILDLPNVHTHLGPTSHALKPVGALLVFAPSVTQIMACVEQVRAQRLPLVLERVLELGTGMAGGREWDVRLVRPRALGKGGRAGEERGVDNELEAVTEGASTEEAVADISAREDSASKVAESASGAGADDGLEMICRPKVGARVVGGGFLGVWRKMRHREKD